ncbi:MAG: hypothetical protein UX42_C0007G0020 [Microgenomates group bacterium GW2011_GWC1_46_20]|nr:MAG: hypothetical protein UX42_C0007G0020 [Microgenomates group bacterium GW2011_GWC1_46_20]
MIVQPNILGFEILRHTQDYTALRTWDKAVVRAKLGTRSTTGHYSNWKRKRSEPAIPRTETEGS